MFWRKKKYNMEMLKMIKPTSKVALKMQTLMIAKGNVEEAEKLYDFLAKDMEELPTFDVVPPTTMQQVRDTAGTIFGWVKENQNDIMQGIEFLKSLKKGGGMPPSGAAPLSPPLPPL